MTITDSQAKVFKLASKDAVRPTLTCVEVARDTVTATDAYKLLSCRVHQLKDANPETSTLVERSAVEKAVKIAKLEKNHLVTVEPSEAIEGDYPDWRKLTTQLRLGKVHKASFNRKYLIELLQAIDADTVELGLGDNRLAAMLVTAEHNKDMFDHRYFGLLMPLRS